MLALLKEMFISLDEDNVISLIPRCIASGCEHTDIFDTLNQAMTEIGAMYSNGVYTLSDLMMAGIIYDEVMKMPEFDISDKVIKCSSVGTILLGTIESDIHDLGKSIFKSAATAAGFDVIDVGIDVSPDVFCENVAKYHPDILAISAIMTTTLTYIQELIEKLEKTGLRSGVKIIIGGIGGVSEVYRKIGADGFAENAFKGVEICRGWIEDANRS